MFRGGAACLLFGACSTVSNGPATDPAAGLSETVFRCNVEPILARQCSYTACHGIAGTALRVYTPGKLRASPPADSNALIAPLTDAEHHANFLSAAAFSFGVGSPDDTFLLRKPLAAVAGGYEHQGGAIFGSPSDAQYVAIRAWLAGQGACK